MDGVTFLLNKIGQALAVAEETISVRDQRISELEAENAQLKAAAGDQATAASAAL